MIVDFSVYQYENFRIFTVNNDHTWKTVLWDEAGCV